MRIFCLLCLTHMFSSSLLEAGKSLVHLPPKLLSPHNSAPPLECHLIQLSCTQTRLCATCVHELHHPRTLPTYTLLHTAEKVLCVSVMADDELSDWECCLLWLSRCQVLYEEIDSVHSLAVILRDGVVLCRLINHLRPNTIAAKNFSQRPQLSQVYTWVFCYTAQHCSHLSVSLCMCVSDLQR